MNGQDAAFLRLLNRLGLLSDEEVEDVYFLFARFSGRRPVDSILLARGYVKASQIPALRARAKAESTSLSLRRPGAPLTPPTRVELPAEAPLVIPVPATDPSGGFDSATPLVSRVESPRSAPDDAPLVTPLEEARAPRRRLPAPDPAPVPVAGMSVEGALRARPEPAVIRRPVPDGPADGGPSADLRAPLDRSPIPAASESSRSSPRRPALRVRPPGVRTGRSRPAHPRPSEVHEPPPLGGWSGRRRAAGFLATLAAVVLVGQLCPPSTLAVVAPMAFIAALSLEGRPSSGYGWGAFALGAGALAGRVLRATPTELDLLLGAASFVVLIVGWWVPPRLWRSSAAPVASALAVGSLLRFGAAAYFGG